jgi:hypothetical protein
MLISTQSLSQLHYIHILTSRLLLDAQQTWCLFQILSMIVSHNYNMLCSRSSTIVKDPITWMMIAHTMLTFHMTSVSLQQYMIVYKKDYLVQCLYLYLHWIPYNISSKERICWKSSKVSSTWEFRIKTAIVIVVLWYFYEESCSPCLTSWSLSAAQQVWVFSDLLCLPVAAARFFAAGVVREWKISCIMLCVVL